ncbi:MAG: hypothetical protein KKA54_15035 [Proteobacteria bacterium]|nr:hypothetical protein [Pseudomonadota bacterium]
MPSRNPFDLITIVGTQFYQPIADLLSKLVTRTYQKPDRVSSNYYEGGYSASIILLLAALIESAVQRDRYFFLTKKPSAKPSNVISIYAKEILHYRRHAHLKEIFDVRNSIAHNHIWEIEFINPKMGGRRHKKSQIVPGTHRLNKVPPSNTRIPRTQRLKLNLQPTRLDRTDVEKVMAANIHFLSHLSNKGHNKINWLEYNLGFKGKRIEFTDILSEIRSTH